MQKKPLSKDLLEIDCSAEADRLAALLVDMVRGCRRRGLVVALSGGIDSSLTAALAVRAMGKERVYGLHMPEKDSSPETIGLSRSVSDRFGFDSEVEELTPVLEALGCYRRRDDAIRTAVPEYGEGWKSKIVLPKVAESTGINFYSVVAQDPSGRRVKARLPLNGYLGVVAATNFKQRIRKTFEYYHADRLNYATTGTPNRLEYDQGFFVKLGDGAADVKPIAHLYKTQVYKMAEFLGVPTEICRRPPTTDTYSLEQGQDEFYFSLPYDLMDICLYAKNNDYSAAEAAAVAGLTPDQAAAVYKDIDAKRRATRHLHAGPVLLGTVPEVEHR
ncbi:MAG: NAD(+) synthase [Fibrobacterota bacterium]|nr:NAD(+) synthase [Fibrobacterota bacterium]